MDLVNDANNESGNVNGGDEVSAFVDMLNYATLHDRKPENIESVSTSSSTLPTPTYDDQPHAHPQHQAHPHQQTSVLNFGGNASSSRSQSTGSAI